MILAPMATKPTPKTSTRTPKARPRRNPDPPAPEPVRADGRPKSALTLAGETAAREAKRELLLQTLKEQGWNLTRTAEALGMGASSAVHRALHDLAPAEYEAARERGDIAIGRPTD